MTNQEKILEKFASFACMPSGAVWDAEKKCWRGKMDKRYLVSQEVAVVDELPKGKPLGFTFAVADEVLETMLESDYPVEFGALVMDLIGRDSGLMNGPKGGTPTIHSDVELESTIENGVITFHGSIHAARI